MTEPTESPSARPGREGIWDALSAPGQRVAGPRSEEVVTELEPSDETMRQARESLEATAPVVLLGISRRALDQAVVVTDPRNKTVPRRTDFWWALTLGAFLVRVLVLIGAGFVIVFQLTRAGSTSDGIYAAFLSIVVLVPMVAYFLITTIAFFAARRGIGTIAAIRALSERLDSHAGVSRARTRDVTIGRDNKTHTEPGASRERGSSRESDPEKPST